MTSRLYRSPFAAVLAYVFSLLLLVGTPVRLLPLADGQGDAQMAKVVLLSDLQADADGDAAGAFADDTREDNSGNGGGNLDDIIHLPAVVRLWAPMPTQHPGDGPYDVGQHDPGRLLRPPEAV